MAQISIEAIVVSLFMFSILISPVSWKILVKPLVGGVFWDYFLIPFKPFCYTLLISLPFYYIFGQTIQIGWMIVCGLSFMLLYSGMVWLFYRKSFFVKSLFLPVVKSTKEYLVKKL